MKDDFAAVYTAIYGGYDSLKPPVVQDVPCDFICFTDDEKIKDESGIWDIYMPTHKEEASPRLNSPVMRAKYLKIMSHIVFPNGELASKKYKYIIWIDGSIQIKSPSFVREICEFVKDGDWALFPHPDRDCVYDEMPMSLTNMNYQSEPLAEQVRAYRAEGHPEHAGLWAGGIIARRADAPEQMKAFNEAWWKENVSWSFQCQLSLAYLIRKLNAAVNTIPKNLWDNEWFEVCGRVATIKTCPACGKQYVINYSECPYCMK